MENINIFDKSSFGEPAKYKETINVDIPSFMKCSTIRIEGEVYDILHDTLTYDASRWVDIKYQLYIKKQT